MSDMKILLSADLNVPESVAAINSAIAKIQDKIIKLHLEVDTSGIKDAKIIMDKFAKSVEQQQDKIKKMGKMSAVSKFGDNTLKSLQTRVNEINKALTAGNKATVSMETDSNNKIKSATITYKNAAGELVKERMKWSSFIKRTMVTNPETGQKEMQKQQWGIFKTTGKTVTDNIEQAKRSMQNLLDSARKGISNIEMKKVGFFDAEKLEKVKTMYQEVETEISSIQKANGRLKETEEIQFKERIQNIQKTIAEYKNLEAEHNRLNRLGVIGNGKTAGFNFGDSQESIRSQIASQISRTSLVGNKSVKSSGVAITSTVIDPKTQQQLVKFTADVETGKNTFTRYKGAVDQASGELRILGETLKSTANRNLDFKQKFAKAMESIPIWMAGMTAFYQTLHFFTDGVGYVNEFNKSLTQLSIVFGESQAQVGKYGSQFRKLANDMSVSTDEVAKSAVEFARQGLQGTDMIDKMTTAIKYAKISNLDLIDSQEILTATVNSMSVTAEHAADVFSYMGDATATGADEIGRAMQRVGGTAGALGISLEKVSSWIAVVSSKTRESAETIGNSMKTILARVQNLREGGFDETDGTKINDVAKALATVGISITNADNTFRNFGDVMDELGQKWQTIDSRTQAYIATTVAGTYQQARFLNLMQGYPETIDLYTKSLSKAGEAQRKFELYQQGTEAKLQKLKNAWTGIFQDTFNDSGIQGIIEVLNKLVDIIDIVVKNIGGLPIVIGIATVAFLTFSKALRTTYLNIGGKFADAIKLTKNNIVSMTLATRLSATAMYGTGTAAKVATVAVKGLAITARALVTAFLPMLALTAVVTIFQKIADAMHNAKVKADELKQRNDTIVESWTANRDAVEKLIKTYSDLDNATQGGKKFADEEQQQKYNQTMSDLAELLPNLVTSIDEKGQAHIKSADAIEKERKNMDLLVEAQRNYRIETSKKEIGDMFQNIADARKKLDKSQQIANAKPYDLSGDPRKFNPTDPNRADPSQIAKYKVQVIVDQGSLADSINAVRDRFKQLVDDLNKSSQTQLGDKLVSYVKGLVDNIDTSTEVTAQAGMSKISDFLKKVQDLRKTINDPNTSRDGLSIVASLSSITEAAKALGMSKEQLAKFSEEVLKIGDNSDQALHQFKNFKTIIDELIGSYKKSADILGDLNGLLDQYADGKAVSAQAAADLIAKDASLVDMFKIEKGQIKINIEAVKEKRDAELDAFNKIARARKEDLINANEALNSMLKIYGIQVHGIQTVADAEAAKNKVTSMTNEELGKHLQSGPDYQKYIDATKGKAADLNEYIDQLGKLSQDAQILSKSLETVGISDKNDKKDKTEKAKKDIEAFDKLSEQFARNMAEVDYALESLRAKMADYSPITQEYRDSLKQENALLGKKQELLHGEANRLKYLRDGYKKQLSAMGEFSKSWSDDQKEKYNSLSQKIADLSGTIDGLSSSWLDAAGQIKTNKLNIDTSTIGEFEQKTTNLNHSLSMIQAKMATYPEDSRKYRETMITQIDVLKKLQANAHAEADAIREQMKAQKENSAEWLANKNTLDQLQQTWWDLQGGIVGVTKALNDQKEKVANDVIQTLKDAYAEQKQIVLDSIDAQIKAIEELHTAQMDSLDKQLSAYEKLIKAKKDSLQATQDERKYNQDLNKAQNDRQEIQNKIDRLALDTSAEGKKKLQELKKQLADANMNIENMQYDHNVELQQNELDNALNAEKERIDNLKENAQYEITLKGKTSRAKYDIAIKELNDEKEAQSKYYDEIINNDRKWTAVKTEILNGHFNDVQTMFDGLTKFIQDNSNKVADYIQTNLIDKIAALKTELSTINPEAAKAMNVFSDIEQMKANAEAWKGSNVAKKAALSAANQRLGEKNGFYFDEATGVWYKDKTKKERVFHEGGIVGNVSGSRAASLVDKLFNTKPNEEVVKALKGEVFTPQDNIVGNFMPNMKRFAQSITPVAIDGGGGSVINVTVNIDKLIGDKDAGKRIASSIIPEVRKLGGKI